MLETLGLSREQKEARRFSLGGSDANALMSGDEERILNLWREKRGQREPDDLSDVLPVQMGSFTEPFNRAWFTAQTGLHVTNVGDERLSFDFPFMTCTLDGIVVDVDFGTPDRVFEAKHVSAFAKDDEIVARYYPQVHHCMVVTGLRQAELSVLFGNHRWQRFTIEFDEAYARQLVNIEEAFWDSVIRGHAPIVQTVSAPVAAAVTYDMAKEKCANEWGDHAATWLAKREAAKAFDAACESIKKLVPPDAAVASASGIKVTRAKNGALTIRETK